MDCLEMTLINNNIEYEIMNHKKPIKSAEEGANLLGISIDETAPTLILKTEKGYFALILSGCYGRVDFGLLKELLGVERIKLAKPIEVEQITGCMPGSVPIINHGLPTIFDRHLNQFEYIYGGTGIPCSTLKIRPADAEKLVNVVGYIR